MADPAQRLAWQQAVQLSCEIEVQLRKDVQGAKPVIAILAKARTEAAAALASLVDVDPEKPSEIRALQNDVRRFTDMVRWLTQILTDGVEAEQNLADEERIELGDLLAEAVEDANIPPEAVGLSQESMHDA